MFTNNKPAITNKHKAASSNLLTCALERSKQVLTKNPSPRIADIVDKTMNACAPLKTVWVFFVKLIKKKRWKNNNFWFVLVPFLTVL